MITFGAASSGGTTTTSLTVSHTAAGNDRFAVIIVVTVNNKETDPATTSVKYDGNSCTKVKGSGGKSNSSRYLQIDLYIYDNPPSGAKSVVATLSAGALSTTMIVVTYTGVDGYDATGEGTGSSGSASANITTTKNGSTIVGGVAAIDSGSQTLTVSGGSTNRRQQAQAGGYANDDHLTALGDRLISTAGATTFAYSLGASAFWSAVAVELLPTPGGMTVLTDHYRRMRAAGKSF